MVRDGDVDPRQEKVAVGPDDPIDPVAVAEAVLDLCDLAIRHLTIDQRGRTSLATKDGAVLRTIVSALKQHRHADAAVTVGSRVRELTPDMQSLGWIRLRFDELCRYAAERQPTKERNRILVEQLSMACVSPPRFKIRPKHVAKAVVEVKRAAQANRKKQQGNDDDLAGLPPDWLRNAASTDDRFNPISASGKLLEAAIRRSGEELASLGTPRNLDAGFSASSTADYAQRVVIQLKASTARSVKPSARLTFLMSVLGAPLDDAPWIAYQLSLLLAGRSLSRAFEPGPDIPTSQEPPAPVPFRLYDEDRKKRIIDSSRQKLLAAGLAEAEASENATYHALHPFTPEPTAWAGTEIGSVAERRLTENPWAPGKRTVVPVKQSRKTNKKRKRMRVEP